MNLAKPEKVALIVLSALLLSGAGILYLRNARPYSAITIVEGGFKQEVTLEDIDARVKEERKVNINIATAEELTAIPGVGEVLAARICEYRQTAGAFRSPKDLMNVKGVGEKKLEQMTDYVKL
jgi:comEA protein